MTDQFSENQKAAVSIALQTLLSCTLLPDAIEVTQPIEKAIAHRKALPKDFREKCIIVLYEAILREGYFAPPETLVQS